MDNEFTLIYGPMFAGKTSELIVVYETYKDNAMCFKPLMDTRYKRGQLVSHDQYFAPCKLVTDPREMIHEINEETAVVLIDEIQFMDYDQVAKTITYFMDMGINVVAAGVDKNHMGVPFETVDRLSEWADNIYHLTSSCESCQKEAEYTVRRHGFDQNAEFLVGGVEAYKPLCEGCFRKHLISI